MDWKLAYIKTFQKILPNAEFIHGDSISDSAGAEMVVGHDLSQIKRADVCIVDARDKIGAGTAQEMVFAKYLNKPLVIVIPKNTHHRKTNVRFHGTLVDEWVHPFLKLSSDYVAESVEEAAQWVREYAQSPNKYSIKNISVFEDAIEHFEAAEQI